MKSEKQLALLQVFGAALFFGLSAPASKFLMNRIDSLVLAGLLYLGSWGALSIFSFFQRVPKGASIGRKHLPWFLASVGIGGILGQLLLMWGISHPPASFASLLINFEIIWTVLVAGLFFGEHLGIRVLLSMGLMFLSGAILSFGGSLGTNFGFLGVLAVVGACLCWGIDNNLTGRISEIDSVQLTRVKGGLSGAVNLGLALFLGRRIPPDPAVIFALILGAVTYGGSLVLFVKALRILGTARTGAFFAVSPFIGAIFSILFLREPLTPNLLLAGLGMALAAFLLLGEKHSHAHLHSEIEHEHFHEHDEHHHHHEGEASAHSHPHLHDPLEHEHTHWPDTHHRHVHSSNDAMG